MEETREGGIWVLAICGKSSGTKGLKYQSAPRGAIHAVRFENLKRRGSISTRWAGRLVEHILLLVL